MSTNFKNKLKASYKKSVKTALSDLSAMNTLLNNYPVSSNTNPLLMDGTYENSVNFSIGILKILGVTEDEIINFFVNLFKSDKEGFLNAIEYSVKGILFANIKKFFDCDINPLIPNSLIETTFDGNYEEQGVMVSLDDIDIMRILDKSPFETPDTARKRNRLDVGGNYYFDVNGYVPNDIWKSSDFNGYLWYIVNRDFIDNKRALYWDNRNIGGVYDYLSTDNDAKELFYSDFDEHGTHLVESVKHKRKLQKFPIIKCRYVEGDGINTTNSIHALISGYYANRKIIGTNRAVISANATIFEFNRDFINSIKLFDRKTLIANIVNAVVGITASFSVNLSNEEKVIKGFIEKSVRKIISVDSNEISDCYFKFSDKEYIEELRKTEDKYANGVHLSDGSFVGFEINDTDIDEINSLIAELEPKDGGVLSGEEETQLIKSVFTSVISKMNRDNGSVDTRYAQFSFGSFIVDKLLTETVQQIVMSLLTPKIGFFFMINSAVMGDLLNVDGKEDFKFKEWKDFLENMPNLIADIIVKVKDVLLAYILKNIETILSPLLLRYQMLLLKESINDWKTLIKQVLTSCALSGVFGRKSKNVYTILEIDNVSGADIYEEDIKSLIKNNGC